jgi:hypothetical protein
MMDNTPIRLVENLVTSYEICKKYEGAAFHGDPYFIQHFLVKIKYEEDTDLTDFFLKLENAMKAASEATESVFTDAQRSLYLFHAMPTTWKDGLQIWKGMRKYVPYEELKMSIEAKVREIQAQERDSPSRGTPETAETSARQPLWPHSPRWPSLLLLLLRLWTPVPIAVACATTSGSAASSSKTCVTACSRRGRYSQRTLLSRWRRGKPPSSAI